MPTSTMLFDFDGTIAQTFEPSPSGIGVEKAYDLAICRIFGNRALAAYDDSGGLRNRSPREVVVELQDACFLADSDTSELANQLVRLKIEYLISSIGQALSDGVIWPRLTPGFREFWEILKADSLVCTGVLSSGHQAFIRRVFVVHDLAFPDVIVTDDELRDLPEPLAKPDSRLFAQLEEAAGHQLLNPVYFGDDAGKDGQFAANCGMPFFQIVPEGSSLLGRPKTFMHWSEVPSLLGVR